MIWYLSAPAFRVWGGTDAGGTAEPPRPSRYQVGSRVTDYTNIALLVVIALTLF